MIANYRIGSQLGEWERDVARHKQAFFDRINAFERAVSTQYPDLPDKMDPAELVDMVSFYAESNAKLCSICLDDITFDDAIISLVCGEIGPPHTFHYACASEWLTTRHACCPECKVQVGKVKCNCNYLRT